MGRYEVESDLSDGPRAPPRTGNEIPYQAGLVRGSRGKRQSLHQAPDDQVLFSLRGSMR